MAEIIGIFASVVGVVGYLPYIRDILKRTTVPHRASWFIWLIEYAVLFAAQLHTGVMQGIWLVGLQLLLVIVISGLAVKYGTGVMDKKSALLFLFVCLTLGIWYFMQDPLLTVTLLIIVELAGVLVTARKVYAQPGSETLSMWTCLIFAGSLSMVSIGHTAEAVLYIYPFALTVMGGSVIVADWLGKQKQQRAGARQLVAEAQSI